MIVATLNKNQNGPETYSITIGTANVRPIRMINPPNTIMPILLLVVKRGARHKQPAPMPMLITAGAMSRKFSQLTPGNGRSHPPKNTVVAIEQTTKMLEYSARKYKAQRRSEEHTSELQSPMYL